MTSTQLTGAHIRRHWWVVLGAIALGIAAALAVTAAATPLYTAQARLIFSLNYSGSATDANQGANFTVTQIPTFAELATSERILEPVIRELSLEETPAQLAERLDITTPADTSVLEVEASSETAADAAALANAVAAEVREYVSRSAPVDEELGPLYTVTMISEATAPAAASFPNRAVNLAVGGLIGLLLGVMLAAWRESADTRVRSITDLRALTGIPVIGSVLRGHGQPSEDAMVKLAVRLRHALRSDVAETDAAERGAALLLTSATTGGGTTTIANGTAQALLDLGTPATVVTATTASSLSSPAASTAATTEGTQETDATTAAAAASREDSPASSSALSREMLAAREGHEIVLVDAPALNDGATAMRLSALDGPRAIVDATVLVVDARTAHRRDVLSALDDLTSSGARVLGIVLNRAHADEATALQRERVRRSDSIDGAAREQGPRREGVRRYFVKTNGGEVGV
ncbi:Wzz/FepE/Etk N-terminal domain-containing protein [Salinibacterium sp. SYSU T00001]|uniref:Wzz/FepE/Etk N-terminal domain-containing protein n=1 Tax=Homoserinimonas sedimenticola TaxID=2986805 RepID=UPI002235CE3B|nr:Wzz/FepE/Etk N-terminal domain-containing protein [Salinibacterium sedimenticola]MCW4385447.1 Wzz/FepE/Etk N-terminal domain-containing protein [Salinibacterium sedimenticola]